VSGSQAIVARILNYALISTKDRRQILQCS
jgi:hypothetical protein